MVAFPTEAVGDLDFAVVFEIEVQIDCPGAFAFRIDAEAQPVVGTPVGAFQVEGRQTGAAAEAPAEHFFRHRRGFEPEAVRSFHGTVRRERNRADAVMGPALKAFHAAKEFRMEHFFLQADRFDGLVFVEPQGLVDVTRFDDVLAESFIDLGGGSRSA